MAAVVEYGDGVELGLLDLGALRPSKDSTVRYVPYFDAAWGLGGAHSGRFERKSGAFRDRDFADGPQWSTSVAVAGPIDVSSSEETPWWLLLLLMSIAILAGECVWQGVLQASLKSWRGAVSIARRKVSAPRQIKKALRVKTYGILDETNRRSVLTEYALAMSPIQEVGGRIPRKTHITAGKQWTATMLASPGPRMVREKKIPNLALSGIILTVDIPPLLPGQIDDKAIIQLSEMLERW